MTTFGTKSDVINEHPRRAGFYCLLFGLLLNTNAAPPSDASGNSISSQTKELVWIDVSSETDLAALSHRLKDAGGQVLCLAPEWRLLAELPQVHAPSMTAGLGVTAANFAGSDTRAIQDHHNHGLGARRPTAAEQQRFDAQSQPTRRVGASLLSLRRATLQGLQGLPSAVDNSATTFFPPIGDQGVQGSCTCWAACYYYNTYTQARDEGVNASSGDQAVVNSPAFMYPLVNAGTNNGAFLGSVMVQLNIDGCGSLASMPYSQSDWTTWPSETAWVEALKNRTLLSHHVGQQGTDSDGDLQAIKQLLANGDLLTTYTDVYANWYQALVEDPSQGVQNGILFSTAGVKAVSNPDNTTASHALTIVGYDDNRTYQAGNVTKRGAFLIANSWGQNWGTTNTIGKRGFMWVAYDFFASTPGCFGLVFYNDDRPHYRPKLYAVAGVNHPHRGDLTFLSGLGSASSPLWQSQCPWNPINAAPGNVIAISDNRRVAVDLTDGVPLISDFSSIRPYVNVTVAAGSTSAGTITSADFYYDLTETGNYQHALSSDPAVIIKPGQSGFATGAFSTAQKQPPTFANPRVTPASGNPSTVFEYLVDYSSAIGSGPAPGWPQVYIDGGAGQLMTLKSGTATSGTYHFSTTLQAGTHGYVIGVVDTLADSSTTPWNSGPVVYSAGDATIDIVVQCAQISPDLQLSYSLTGVSGPWTSISVKQAILPALVLPMASHVWFKAGVLGNNFAYNGWEGWERGTKFGSGGSGANFWGIQLGPNSTEIGVNVFYAYTPQRYTISGTVALTNGAPVPGGVDLVLSSSALALTNHVSGATWSFPGVLGGVSITITPVAAGYEFTPATFVINDLSGDQTGLNFAASSSDDLAPMMHFSSLPPQVSTNPGVTLSWMGQDNVSPPPSLLYQHRLDGIDPGWSAWASANTTSYALSNGCYTFWVTAMDQAGNVNHAPASYTFVVNAQPAVTSAVRVNRSVWASRVTLQQPATTKAPGSSFVLLPEHSGVGDADLVPVALHRADEVMPIGANQIVAKQQGLQAIITKTGKGWFVAVPDPLAPGQSAAYDVTWGKPVYFGWHEKVPVAANFPDGGNVMANYLDGNLALWQLAIKNDSTLQSAGIGYYKTWIWLAAANASGPLISEKLLRYGPEHPFDGTVGYQTYYGSAQASILPAGPYISALWTDDKSTYDGHNNGYYHRWGVQVCNTNGVFLNTYDSPYTNGIVRLPASSIGDVLWFLQQESANGNTLLGMVLDYTGNPVSPVVTIDTVTQGSNPSFDDFQTFPIGTGALMIWERSWMAKASASASSYFREELDYAIYSPQGQALKSRTVLTPLLGDTVAANDRFKTSWRILGDRNGKAWIPYTHYNDQLSTYYYVVLASDGSIWKGPVQTAALRSFDFCDRDGLIWASEAGQSFVLNPDGTTNAPPRTSVWSPNQQVGALAASVGNDGYRIYDRWSPQLVNVDVVSGASPNTMELYDLDLWTNGLHTANVNIQNATTPIFAQTGQFTGRVSVVVTGTIPEGRNTLNLTQTDMSGGQVLVTFPYVYNHLILAGGDGAVSISPAGSVVVTNGGTVTFTFTPSIGHHVANVQVDGVSVGTNTIYTFQNVTADHTLFVSSALDATNVAPVILQQPVSQVIAQGGNAAFTVIANGAPPPTYQWFFSTSGGSNAILSATNATLILTNVQPAQSGGYYVTVSNVTGSVTTSPLAILTVNVPPTITSLPTNQTVMVGGNASFSAVASGTAPLSYQWLLNGSALSGQNSATLALSNVQTNQAGQYAVVVSNVAGSVTSAPAATLTVSVRTNATSVAIIRNLPLVCTNGVPFTVTLSVTPPANETGTYVVEDQPALGWAVTNISDQGTVFGAQVAWPLTGNAARTLSYLVTPPLWAWGTNVFVGQAAFPGITNVPVTGTSVTIPLAAHLKATLVKIIDLPLVNLNVSGVTNRTYQIQFATGLGPGVQWQTATSLTMDVPNKDWTDPTPMGPGRRFYRAVLAP